MDYTRTIAKLENKHGQPVVLTATAAGNGDTGEVVSLSLFPKGVYDAIREEYRGVQINSIKLGAEYVKMMAPEIKTVCGICPLQTTKGAKKINQFGCYVQTVGQSASQPASYCRNADDRIDGMGWDLQGLASVLDMSGATQIRSMVAGDAGMLTREDWETLEDFIRSNPKVIRDIVIQWAWLGYTHQPDAVWLQNTHQLSTQSTQGNPYGQATRNIKKGWGVFHVLGKDVTERHPDMSLCYKQEQKHRGLSGTCSRCPMPCDGEGRRATVVVNHGPGSSHAKKRILTMWTGQ